MICRAVPSAAFRAMLPLKALGDDDVGGAPADTVALDEADIFQLRQVHRAQQLRRLANFLAALDFLNNRY